MGLSGLGVFSLQALLPAGSPLRALAYVIHPVGYIAVIIGRAQRFTENTLYPVILVMDECRHLFKTFGSGPLSLLPTLLGHSCGPHLCQVVCPPPGNSFPVRLSRCRRQSGATVHFFWSGVIGGWLIALVAWTGHRQPLGPSANSP